jgi:hypothetical protein
MRKKSSFSIQGRAILFACTTTLISPYRALNFFEMNSTPSPFLLLAIPLLS